MSEDLPFWRKPWTLRAPAFEIRNLRAIRPAARE